MFFHPPQLKAGLGDRCLDHATVQIVGRRSVRPDNADRVPGRNCTGSLPPPWSSEKACKPGLVSDLKMKMRIVEDPVANLVQNLRPRAGGFGLPLASSRGFLGGALISPSKIAFLRAALRSRRTASLFSRAACSDGFS